MSQSESLEELEKCLGKVAEGMDFNKAIISFYIVKGRLGSESKIRETASRKSCFGEPQTFRIFYS